MIAFSLLRFPIRSPARCGWSWTRPFLGKALWLREGCSGSGGGARGGRRVHVSSEPLVGHVAALPLLQCGAHVDLFRKVLFCRARPGAAPERSPAGAADRLATRLLKRAASSTCSTPSPPLPL